MSSLAAAAVESLSVTYGDSIALAGVSLSLAPGEIAGLLGASGSGKSTLARAIHRRLPRAAKITSGRISVSASTALIPQEPALSLSPYVRVGVQVADCSHERPVSPSHPRVLEIFDQLDLPDPVRTARAYPHQLSGGQRQRVAWAQALIQQPGLLLADEPFTAVDAVLQRELTSLVLGIARASGMAVLWISHDPEFLLQVASRVLVLHRGEIVEDARPHQLLGSPSHPHTRSLLEAAL